MAKKESQILKKKMEGFSEDFNWKSLKATSEEAERVLFVSEQKRIQNIVIEAMQNNCVHAIFEFNFKLSISKQRALLEELCKRFPERVWTADSDGRWAYDPKKPDSGGSEFGIHLL